MNMNGTQILEDATPSLLVIAIILLCPHSTVPQNVVTVRMECTRTVVHFHVGAAGNIGLETEVKADVHIPTIKMKMIKDANTMAVVMKALIIDHPCSHRIADVTTILVTIHTQDQDLLAEVNTRSATEYGKEA
ncbi:hypothetical protein ACEPAG_3132 [Sanghuangporus baumii]